MTTPRDNSDTITVSRATLRVELLETEIRLKEYFDSRLEMKASVTYVQELNRRVALGEAGEFTPAQFLRFEHIIAEHLSKNLRSNWALRGNKIALLVGGSAFTAMFIAIFNLLRSLH
jgi:hypothetical protein